MMIDSVVAVAQCCEVAPFHSFFKRSFQSFGVGQKIQRFNVLRFLLQFGFGEAFSFTSVDCETPSQSLDRLYRRRSYRTTPSCKENLASAATHKAF